jgi:hemerythrin-like domain-containing protein
MTIDRPIHPTSRPTGSRASAAALHAPGLTDVRGMIAAHDAFRWGFAPIPRLVREVRDGDRRRAVVVARHLETMLRMLEAHHSSEDELLWPRLLERVPDELAPVVRLMAAQHEGIHDQLERVLALLPYWRATGARTAGAGLAGAVDELVARLLDHMAAEETRLLPLAARCITEEEWAALGRRSMEKMPLRFLPVVLGAMRQIADPEVLADDLAKAPAPLRFWLQLTADRAFRRYAHRLGLAST